jgi:hypothetical protein
MSGVPEKFTVDLMRKTAFEEDRDGLAVERPTTPISLVSKWP